MRPGIEASAGQSLRMLWRATLRFSELNALVASARRMASLLSESRHLLAACTAASMPDNCPPRRSTDLFDLAHAWFLAHPPARHTSCCNNYYTSRHAVNTRVVIKQGMRNEEMRNEEMRK